jgi:hypothetical protein
VIAAPTVASIFDTASKISTPLALAGFIAAVFFLVVKQIIAKNVFPKFSEAIAGGLLQDIINKLFILALVAMVLGFAGYALAYFGKARTPQDSMAISLTSDMTFRQAAELIAGNDNQTVTFPNCGDDLLNAKLKGGTISGGNAQYLLDTLRYWLVTPAIGAYKVVPLKDRGVYEIQCTK